MALSDQQRNSSLDWPSIGTWTPFGCAHGKECALKQGGPEAKTREIGAAKGLSQASRSWPLSRAWWSKHSLASYTHVDSATKRTVKPTPPAGDRAICNTDNTCSTVPRDVDEGSLELHTEGHCWVCMVRRTAHIPSSSPSEMLFSAHGEGQVSTQRVPMERHMRCSPGCREQQQRRPSTTIMVAWQATEWRCPSVLHWQWSGDVHPSVLQREGVIAPCTYNGAIVRNNPRGLAY